MASPPLKVVALNCSLKSGRSSEPSSTEKLLAQVLGAFATHDAHSDGETPEKVAKVTKMLTANAAHLARLLKEKPYPGV